jgi:hypothetical protein
MKLANYLENIIGTSHYPVSFPGDKPIILNRWMVTGIPEKEAILSDTDPGLNTNSRIILRNEVGLPRQELETNWRYAISDDSVRFYNTFCPEKMFEIDQSKFIFSLSNVYSDKPRDVLLYYQSLTQEVKVWSNGEIIISSSFGYNTQPVFVVIQLKKGNNSVLVRRWIEPKREAPHPFRLVIRPVQQLHDDKYIPYLEPNFFRDLKNSYRIIPEKICFAPTEAIRFLILPKTIRYQNEPIKVQITDANGEVIKIFENSTSKTIRLDLDQTVNGVLRIQTESLTVPKKTATILIYRGDYKTDRVGLLQKAKDGLDPKNPHHFRLLNIFQKCLEIYDVNEMIGDTFNEDMAELWLTKYLEFQHWVNSLPGSANQKLPEVCHNSIIDFVNMGMDDNFLSYRITLPQNYNPNRKYPLVITAQYGYIISRYPRPFEYEKRREFKNMILMDVCGRGELNQDYLYETNLIRAISQVVSEYNIDRERISINGACVAAFAGFGLALRFPDLFAGLASVTGTVRMDLKNPDYEYLKNMTAIHIYNLDLFNDDAFHFVRNTGILRDIPSVKNLIFSDFDHMEFNDLFNNVHVAETLRRWKRPKMPKKLQFTVYEPMYNKSYWLMVNCKESLEHKAVIKAEVRSRQAIVIETENIHCFSLLLSPGELGLNRRIELKVNSQKQNIELNNRVRLVVTLAPELQVDMTLLTKTQFDTEYQRIDIDQDRLGLKELYLSRCLVIKADSYQAPSKKAFARKIFYLLQSPLKERIRNYNYPSLFESETSPANLKESNFILLVDARDISPFQQEILDNTGLESLKSSVFKVDGKEYPGEFFGFIKVQNPYNPEKWAMIVVYNYNDGEEEMIKFLNTFDNNGLFYSDAVIYHQGRFHSFRKRMA